MFHVRILFYNRSKVVNNADISKLFNIFYPFAGTMMYIPVMAAPLPKQPFGEPVTERITRKWS